MQYFPNLFYYICILRVYPAHLVSLSLDLLVPLDLLDLVEYLGGLEVITQSLEGIMAEVVWVTLDLLDPRVLLVPRGRAPHIMLPWRE